MEPSRQRQTTARGRIANRSLRPHQRRGIRPAAFTLLELMVVMAILAILAALLLPALGNAKCKAQCTTTSNNLKQLTAAMIMYADEYDDMLLAPCDYGWTFRGIVVPSWDGGQWLHLPVTEQDEVDPFAPTGKAIRNSPLWDFLGQSPGLFKDPHDRSRGSHPNYQRGAPAPRVRSYSLNGWVLGEGWPASGETWRRYPTLASITDPGPSELMFFISERPDSIQSGHFAVDMRGFDPDRPLNFVATIGDFPAAYHGHKRGAMSFADGHTDFHRWQDARTMPPLDVSRPLQLNVPSPNNPDVFWLQQHSSARAK